MTNDNDFLTPISALPIRAEAKVNDPAVEFLFMVCTGHEPARQKRIIVTARGLDIIDDVQAEIACNALGLEAA